MIQVIYLATTLTRGKTPGFQQLTQLPYVPVFRFLLSCVAFVETSSCSFLKTATEPRVRNKAHILPAHQQ